MVENIELLIAKMPNLETLNIDAIGLVSLPPSFMYNNHKMKNLNVSGNYLINLDSNVLAHLSQIETLDLSSNYFLGFEQGFFDSLKNKNRLKMVYLQVISVILRFTCLSISLASSISTILSTHRF